MLRNRRAGTILQQLRFLEQRGIRFHAQIVLCPGVNDGGVLRRTVDDLRRFREGLLSLAVVPVGLTRHRTNAVRPVTPQIARKLVAQLERWSERDRKRVGVRRIFASDEFYIRAGRRLPPRSYYGDYPQIENGVGLVRQLLEEWRKQKRRRSKTRVVRGPRSALSRRATTKYLVVTSVDAYPHVRRVASELAGRCRGVELEVKAVRNEFFGDTVTVAGLLTGRDIVRAVRKDPPRPDVVVVPGVVFNYRGYTLDGFSVRRLQRRLRVALRVAGSVSELAELVASRR